MLSNATNAVIPDVEREYRVVSLVHDILPQYTTNAVKQDRVLIRSTSSGTPRYWSRGVGSEATRRRDRCMSMRAGVLGGVEARVRQSECECGNWGEFEGYAHEFGVGVRHVRRGSVNGEESVAYLGMLVGWLSRRVKEGKEG
jgi:hypothetical protein